MRKFFLTAIFVLVPIITYADERIKIYSLLNKPILASTTFSGQSFTLMKDDTQYYIVRHYLPSGVSEGPKKKYSVEFKSNFQLRFDDSKTNETFIISIGDNNRIELFLNDLEVVLR